MNRGVSRGVGGQTEGVFRIVWDLGERRGMLMRGGLMRSLERLGWTKGVCILYRDMGGQNGSVEGSVRGHCTEDICRRVWVDGRGL